MYLLVCYSRMKKVSLTATTGHVDSCVAFTFNHSAWLGNNDSCHCGSGKNISTAAKKPQDEGRAGRVEQGMGYLKTANRFIGNVRLRSDLLKSRSAASARLPDFVEPMKAKLVDALPAGNWIYEIKFDGYRALALRGGNETRVLSRNEKDLGKKFPEVNDSIAAQGRNAMKAPTGAPGLEVRFP